MKTIAARCAAALLSLAAAGAVLSSAPAAFASTHVPLPKVAANTNGLRGQVRPNHIFAGNGEAPTTRYLWWTSYGPRAGEATGTVWWPTSYARPRDVTVDVWRPVHYAGHPGQFFTRMTWEFRSRTTGRMHTVLFWFGNPYGGTLQVWYQR